LIPERRPPHERPAKTVLPSDPPVLKRVLSKNRSKNYFALTFALSFEMRKTDRFFSWGPCGFLRVDFALKELSPLPA
jgi:hypothetical protein